MIHDELSLLKVQAGEQASATKFAALVWRGTLILVVLLLPLVLVLLRGLAPVGLAAGLPLKTRDTLEGCRYLFAINSIRIMYVKHCYCPPSCRLMGGGACRPLAET